MKVFFTKVKLSSRPPRLFRRQACLLRPLKKLCL
jgi:hypothetical protein